MATPTLKPTINKYQEAKNLVNSHQKAREQVRTEGMSDIYISFKNLNLSPEEYAYMKKKLEGENFLEKHFLDFERSDEYQEALALEAEAEGMIQNMIEK
jgi:nicotinic acid phosphoribosyltransferase